MMQNIIGNNDMLRVTCKNEYLWTQLLEIMFVCEKFQANIMKRITFLTRGDGLQISSSSSSYGRCGCETINHHSMYASEPPATHTTPVRESPPTSKDQPLPFVAPLSLDPLPARALRTVLKLTKNKCPLGACVCS